MKQVIIILHGWGLSGKRYEAIKDNFEKKGFSVLSPDFPGFGVSSLPKEEMYLDDYVHFLEEYVKKHAKTPVILIGHSFGGRVATKFTAKNPSLVKALILTGAPLIRKPLSLRKLLVQLVVKRAKNLVPKRLQEIARKSVYRFLGEWDYYKAGALKKTLRNILAEDLSPYLGKIKAPTLLLWGEKDTFVSASIGKEIVGSIKNAHWIEIKGGTHKLPYENPKEFAGEVLKFLKTTV